MTYNAANRKDIRIAEKSALMTATINREVIAGLMSVKNGRHWVYDQLAASFVFTDPFSPDSQVLAYNCGLRAAGIRLFNDLILYAPDNFVTMIKEAHERSLTDAARRDAAARSASGPEDYPGYPTEGSEQFDEFGRPTEAESEPA